MRIRNIHERRVAGAGSLLDTLAGPADSLWPRGGHGPIRYSVEAYDPRRAVTFRLQAPHGLDGRHGFVAEGDVLRHVLDGRATGGMRLGWPLFFRPLHDALVEDLLDKAAGCAPRPFGRRVRLLRALGRRCA